MDALPLNPNILKGLGESKYEKRKGAALDLERYVRDLLVANNGAQIQTVIQSLIEGYVNNSNATMKAGGLMGLAAVSIALGQTHITEHLESLLLPVLACLEHQNNQVRYAACEALFNVCKVSRGHLLPFFEKLFHGAARLATDQDQAVRNGGEVFNNLLKSIVTEASPGIFDYSSCVTLLRHYSGTTSAFGRHFIIGWIMTLDGKADFSVLRQLPDFLFRLFEYLGDKQGTVVIAADNCLSSMLKRLGENADGLDLSTIANTVIANCGHEDRRIQSVAMNWLANVIELAPKSVIRVLSGALRVVLIALSYDLTKDQAIVGRALTINSNLSVLVTPDLDNTDLIDMQSIITVLTDLIRNPNSAVPTRIETVRWIQTFFTRLPNLMHDYIMDLFPVLVQILQDVDERVVMISLQVLVDIGSRFAENANLADEQASLSALLIASILGLLKSASVNEERFVAIVRQWSVLSRADHVFGGFADYIMESYQKRITADHSERNTNETASSTPTCQLSASDRDFAIRTVRILNRVLFYAPEALYLRQALAKGLDSDDKIFAKLFQAWAHCPASALALALLAKRYRLASSLVQATANLPVTVDLLFELDKLVQYLESPLFSCTRLHLLEPQYRMNLERCLYGILMLLPQSTAFHALHRRLSTLPPAMPACEPSALSEAETKECATLLEHFKLVQSAYERSYRREQIALIQSMPVSTMLVQGGSPESQHQQQQQQQQIQHMNNNIGASSHLVATPTSRRQ